MLLKTEGLHGIIAIMNHIASPFNAKLAFRKIGHEKIILLNSVHRSGSTWLTKMICESTGLPSWQPEFLRERYPHFIEEDDAERLRSKSFITKLHIPSLEPTISTLKNMNCKTIFLHRDLRDVAVSWSHYILSRTHTPEYKKLGLSKKTTISEMIDYYIDHQLTHDCHQIKQWSSTPDHLVHKIRFNELKKDPKSTLNDIIKFCGLEQKKNIEEVIENNRIKIQNKSKKNINKGRTRTGKSGQWEDVFSSGQMQRFAAIKCEILN